MIFELQFFHFVFSFRWRRPDPGRLVFVLLGVNESADGPGKFFVRGAAEIVESLDRYEARPAVSLVLGGEGDLVDVDIAAVVHLDLDMVAPFVGFVARIVGGIVSLVLPSPA